MPELLLTEDQSETLKSANGPVAVRDTRGHIVGHLEPPLTPEFIAELKRRAAEPGPRYTGEQVHRRLEALQEEWDKRGGFDKTTMLELLAEMNRRDPGHMKPGRSAE